MFLGNNWFCRHQHSSPLLTSELSLCFESWNLRANMMRSCSTVYFVFKMKIQEECCNVHNAQLLPWCYQLLPRHLHKMDQCNLTSLLPSILHKSSLCYSILIAKHITLVPTCVSSKAFTLVNSILQLYYTILIAYILLLAPILALPDDSKPVARFYPWR